jgi:hypothetical protein
MAGLPQKKKTGMSIAAKGAIAATLGILVILLVSVMISNNAKGKINKRYNELVALAAMGNTNELPVNSKDLDILLNEVVSIGANTSRETIYKALYIAESTDGTNVDAKLVNFATTVSMNEVIRTNLLRRVIGGRIVAGHKETNTANALLAFVKSNPNPESAAAAIEALKGMATEEHFADLVGLLQFSSDANIRKRCEEVAVAIIKQSPKGALLGGQLEPAYSSSISPEVKQALLRVIATTGSPKAKEWVLENLKGSDKAMQIAAADAAKNWPDNALIEPMLGVLDNINDPILRSRVFHSCREFLISESERNDGENSTLWEFLASAAKQDSEQEAVIRSLVTNSSTNTKPWAAAIIKNYEEKADSDRVVDLAGKALDRINSLTKKDDSKDE